jgi:hypothetical protein
MRDFFLRITNNMSAITPIAPNPHPPMTNSVNDAPLDPCEPVGGRDVVAMDVVEE